MAGKEEFDPGLRQAFVRQLVLSTICPSQADRRHWANGVSVRVIEYRLEGAPGAEPLYRLVTTILDPEAAPTAEMAALYHERWEIETALDEIKTHLRGAKMVLRLKHPDLVRQEFYGLMLANFAIRGLMHEAALTADEEIGRLSFIIEVKPQFIQRLHPLKLSLTSPICILYTATECGSAYASSSEAFPAASEIIWRPARVPHPREERWPILLI